MYALLLGLLSAAAAVAPSEQEGFWSYIHGFGAFPAFLAGIFYGKYGISKYRQTEGDSGTDESKNQKEETENEDD